ncbi:hypothetical protein QQX98_009875 [Neonectria punicea]|uniref:Zn(2)-C6 fungal-type domain-containing protein n=1 Tax=Neonectria punicea TaxID=979145 RepID=A0ABR1GR12_9HYPO
MPGQEDTQKTALVRQRKPHRKSRLGCGNCKLRSVKCDEAKPGCKRCAASGFVCNYSRTAPALQLAGTLKMTLDLPAPLPGLRIPVAGPVAGAPNGSYKIGAANFAALHRFRTRTVLTVGSAGTRHLYRDGAFDLGITHPFLLHVFLTLSLLHDTHLAASTTSAAHRSSLAFHWYHGTALFHRNLASASQRSPQSLSGPYRDALWASAAILGAAAFFFVGPADSAAAWPLKAPSSTDLDWLKMSDGKKVVWHITDPTRPESVFNPLLADHALYVAPDGQAPIPPTALPAPFYPLYDLSESTPDANPYHVAASLMAQLLDLEANDYSVIQFLAFISQLDPRYRRLLELKDPRAMLLLAYWHAKVVGFKAWWLNRRAVVEGQAICIYLERECADDPMIMELLEFPKASLFKGTAGYDKSMDRVLDIKEEITLRGGEEVY